MSLVEEAASVEQYNSTNMDWASEGDSNSPSRRFIKRSINIKSNEISGKRILDVGCGTGWFLQECLNGGAVSVVGLEPSNFAITAAKNLPETEILKSTFEDYYPQEADFDLISFIMCTEHIPDLNGALRKAHSLLKSSGKLIILTADFVSFQAKRRDYIVTKEVINEGKEVVVRTERPSHYGTTTDILRSKVYWRECINSAGFSITQHAEILIDQQYADETGKHDTLGWPAFQLFRLSK